jgi:hypothetical protein
MGHTKLHAIGGADHNPDTLANINAKVSDLIATYGGLRDIGIGTAAQRPAAGTAGRLWIATDTYAVSRDNGSAWEHSDGLISATASVAGTTLTLTPPATLTKGVWQFVASIRSLDTNAAMSLFVNGDTTTSNYRCGRTFSSQSTASGEQISDTVTMLTDINTWGTITGTLIITDESVHILAQVLRTRASAATSGRQMVYSAYHISATNVSSIQMTSSVADKIDAGSFISMWRKA